MPLAASSSRDQRVALIGYGLAGSVFHAPLIATTPGLRLAAIVTANADRQAQAQRDYPDVSILTTADDLWRTASDYDVVVVGAPNRAHVSLSLAALEAGLAVVIDKPMAATVSEGERLIAGARAAGKLLTVFQNRRWDADFRTLRQIVESGMLGPITRFESRYERFRPQPRSGVWRESAAPEEAGGLLYDLGSHLIDQALTLFGRPTTVYAEVERRRAGVQVDDDTFVALQFPSGVRAHLWMSAIAPLFGPRFHVSGLTGAYEKYGMDPQEDSLVAGLRPGDSGWGIEPREQWGRLSVEVGGLRTDGKVESLPGAYEQFYALLRDALTSGGPPPVDPADAVAALRVIEAASKSARTGTTVRYGAEA